MSCEIYDDLRNSYQVITNEPNCQLEKECPKTCEACIFMEIFNELDEIGDNLSVMPGDISRDKEASRLEAERRKNNPTYYDILADIEFRTEISIRGRN